jgi:hypothetical protein
MTEVRVIARSEARRGKPTEGAPAEHVNSYARGIGM